MEKWACVKVDWNSKTKEKNFSNLSDLKLLSLNLAIKMAAF